jgi:hypothetical protein
MSQRAIDTGLFFDQSLKESDGPVLRQARLYARPKKKGSACGALSSSGWNG